MKAIVCAQWGEPEQVLAVREVPEPVCGPGQVRVRMLASPINPSDRFMIRGIYGRQPPLPCIPGFEGVGIVEQGRGLLAWRVAGKRVAVLNSNGGNWAEKVVIPARQAVPVPPDLTDEQAATFFVNPASAIVMTQDILNIPAGAWLLQTAANSALGRMVIRLGVKHGFRTMNVVRRRDQVEELQRLGRSLRHRLGRRRDRLGLGGNARPRRPNAGLQQSVGTTVDLRPSSVDDRAEANRRILAVGMDARPGRLAHAPTFPADQVHDSGRRARYHHWRNFSSRGNP
jgi:NADPH:quinone reductase-like Zn-dependent oxidoreductase